VSSTPPRSNVAFNSTFTSVELESRPLPESLSDPAEMVVPPVYDWLAVMVIVPD